MIDVLSGVLTVALAGHPPPVRVQQGSVSQGRGPENLDTLSTRALLGNVHRRLGDLDKAREFLLPEF